MTVDSNKRTVERLTGHRTTECCKTMRDTPSLRLELHVLADFASAYKTTSLPYTRQCAGQRTLDSSRKYNTRADQATHDVFYRGLCDIIRLVPFLATSHHNTNRNDETSMLVLHANVTFQTRKCQTIHFLCAFDASIWFDRSDP